jgi:hypothetical protein
VSKIERQKVRKIENNRLKERHIERQTDRELKLSEQATFGYSPI